MANAQSPLPPLTARWVETPSGVPSLIWRQYLLSLDALARGLAGGNVGPLVTAANDTAAATAGVKIGGLYHDATGVVRIRLG
jgi:hypothetical protein